MLKFINKDSALTVYDFPLLHVTISSNYVISFLKNGEYFHTMNIKFHIFFQNKLKMRKKIIYGIGSGVKFHTHLSPRGEILSLFDM